MSENTQIYAINATPPEQVKRQSLKLVYKNTRLPQYPAFMALRFVHATFPNDAAVNYVELVRTGQRMLKSEFDKHEADGTFVPTHGTAAIPGKVKPSRQSEILHSDEPRPGIPGMWDLLKAA